MPQKRPSRQNPVAKRPPSVSKTAKKKESSSFSFPKLPPFLERPAIWLDKKGGLITEEPLIRFDRKSLGVIGIFLMLFLVLTLSGIHYSSIGYWDTVITEPVPEGKDSRVLAGTPKLFRVDEWRVASSTIFSQYNQGFPVENPAIGAGRSPLVMNIPVKHFTAFFMPQHWGFHLLSFETGFSFLWNYRVFALLISTFLLLMLFTRNQVWLSLAGALALLFSSFTQWWFSSFIGEYITAVNLVVVSSLYLFFSARIKVLFLNALIFLLFAVNFIIIPYPPFQVPLFYLMITLFTGFLISRFDRQKILRNLPLKGILILTSLILLGIILFLFYNDIRETIEMTTQTAYPGKRISTGGEIGWDRFFSGFYSVFFSEQRFIWLNVCETSNFILLFPFVIAALAVGYFRKIKDPVQIALVIFLLVMTWYTVVGIFPFLAKLTFLSYVPSRRAYLATGIASVYLMMIYLSDKRPFLPSGKGWMAGILVASLLIFYLFGRYISTHNNNAFQDWEVAVITLFFGIATVLLLYKKKIAFTLMFLFMSILSTYDVSPVSRGTGFYDEKLLYQSIRRIVEKDPEARWALFNEPGVPSFAIAAGARVINGTKYLPDIPLLRTFDPEGKNDSIYNRYSNLGLAIANDTAHIRFQLLYEDMCILEVSPLNSRFRSLGIKYLMVPATPGQYNVEMGKQMGLIPVYDRPIDNFHILRQSD